jgi:hypothetical protein
MTGCFDRYRVKLPIIKLPNNNKNFSATKQS